MAQQWISHYGGPVTGESLSQNEAYAIALCDGGQSCVTGFCAVNSTVGMCTIKYTAGGDTEWVRYYTGTGGGDNKAYAICVDSAQYVYVTGYSSGTNGPVITTIKYSADGVQQWVRAYTVVGVINGDDKAYAITVDKLGNVFVAGGATNIYGNTDMVAIKYNSEGVQQWVGVYDGSGHSNDFAYSIALASNGDVVITGYSRTDTTQTSEDYATVKFNGNTGDTVWVRHFNGSGNGEDVAKKVLVDPSGNIYITGYSYGDTTGYDIVTIKYGSGGDTLWTQRYNGPGNSDDIANSMCLVPNGGVVVVGSTKASSSPGTENYITLYYNQDGILVWATPIDRSGKSDIAYSVAVSDSSNLVYITGSSQTDTTVASADVLTVILDMSTGNLVQEATYNGPTNNQDVAYDIKVDSVNNVYVTGYSAIGVSHLSNGLPTSIMSMKYDKGGFIKVNKLKNVPTDFKLYQNYPNPFNPSTTIKFDILKSSRVKLVVYNILGQQVALLLNEYMKEGSYKVEFNIPGLSSGVYFYQMSTDSFRDVKKMVLIK